MTKILHFNHAPHFQNVKWVVGLAGLRRSDSQCEQMIEEAKKRMRRVQPEHHLKVCPIFLPGKFCWSPQRDSQTKAGHYLLFNLLGRVLEAASNLMDILKANLSTCKVVSLKTMSIEFLHYNPRVTSGSGPQEETQTKLQEIHDGFSKFDVCIL